jgi:DNA (cytosine-5)-methyltransferase 1
MPTVGSFASGYGGLDLAVCDLFGARLAWVADPYTRTILDHRFLGVPNLGDVTDPGRDWTRVERVDIWVAGLPCQPWSQAGSRRGTDDARDLWPAARRALGVLRPRLLVLENVPGFARSGLGRTLGDLAALGYDTRWSHVAAADVGAAHLRSRWFCLAWLAPDAEREQPERRRGLGVVDGAA